MFHRRYLKLCDSGEHAADSVCTPALERIWQQPEGICSMYRGLSHWVVSVLLNSPDSLSMLANSFVKKCACSVGVITVCWKHVLEILFEFGSWSQQHTQSSWQKWKRAENNQNYPYCNLRLPKCKVSEQSQWCNCWIFITSRSRWRRICDIFVTLTKSWNVIIYMCVSVYIYHYYKVTIMSVCMEVHEAVKTVNLLCFEDSPCCWDQVCQVPMTLSLYKFISSIWTKYYCPHILNILSWHWVCNCMCVLQRVGLCTFLKEKKHITSL